MTPRYGQLTYTSLDGDGTTAGWQVKETTGGITPQEARLLVSRIRIPLNPIEQPPRFPTPDQVRALPRRLAYSRINDSIAAYWHTAPAGLDSTGRPGNVFAHVLLDREASDMARNPRPIELWQSSRWLTPYGGSAVSAAMLSDEVPGTGGAVTAESVVRFVCDVGMRRLRTLCGLLDAVSAALDGGPAVVMGVESADTAAQWIGAVSFMMSRGTAGRLNFSTFDRSSDLEDLLRSGLHLVAMPRADLADVPPVAVAIDDAESITLGELHGRQHCTHRSQEIAVTAWSAMARVAFVDPISAAELLAAIDECASDLIDAGLPPALPMAISALDRRWGEDLASEAKSVIATDPQAARMYWS